ncbi:hypothetical protein ABTX81_06305 [Kitasatospora sp. NPDC097605]|uniref:hypothetical protein n=1 Tax=Kitasatospora sp. NPDC097605 TaxID=3157226 RepID=UPI003323578A
MEAHLGGRRPLPDHSSYGLDLTESGGYMAELQPWSDSIQAEVGAVELGGATEGPTGGLAEQHSNDHFQEVD